MATHLNQMISALQEAQKTADERDALKNRVRQLESQLRNVRCTHNEDYYRGIRDANIDAVIAQLGDIQKSPDPVGPLVEASISVLTAAKILLSQCSDTLVGKKR